MNPLLLFKKEHAIIVSKDKSHLSFQFRKKDFLWKEINNFKKKLLVIRNSHAISLPLFRQKTELIANTVLKVMRLSQLFFLKMLHVVVVFLEQRDSHHYFLQMVEIIYILYSLKEILIIIVLRESVFFRYHNFIK